MPEYIKEFLDKGFELILQGDGEEFFKAYEDEFSNMLERTIFIKLNSCNVRIN
jgi:hypothetical protein